MSNNFSRHFYKQFVIVYNQQQECPGLVYLKIWLPQYFNSTWAWNCQTIHWFSLTYNIRLFLTVTPTGTVGILCCRSRCMEQQTFELHRHLQILNSISRHICFFSRIIYCNCILRVVECEQHLCSDFRQVTAPHIILIIIIIIISLILFKFPDFSRYVVTWNQCNVQHSKYKTTGQVDSTKRCQQRARLKSTAHRS